MEYFQAPAGLEQRLREQLLPPDRRKQKATRPGWLTGWQSWAVAASLIAVLLLTATLTQLARRPSHSDMIAQEVVSSHIRSLLANHLSDVVSTDQHTVKPWFSGKLDFAPVVRDLAPQGFPLVGGRLDYLNDRAVAALVYKRRQHTINLFLWPAQASDASPRKLTVRGYNVVHWTQAHMNYWAVSDINDRDLDEFARDLKG